MLEVRSVQAPLIIAMPVAIMRTPPVMLMVRMWRRRNVMLPVAQFRPAAAAMKGNPRPRQ